MFEFIRDFEGEIQALRAKDCGKYLDQNLGMAKWQAKKYLDTCLYCIREEKPGLSRIRSAERIKQRKRPGKKGVEIRNILYGRTVCACGRLMPPLRVF